MDNNTTRPLTMKQKAFCDHYIANNGNGTQAAREAGYKGNDVTLGAVSTENLRKPLIKAYIDANMQPIREKIVEKYVHTREIAYKLMMDDYDRLREKAEAGNVAAINARAAIMREVNEIGGLRKQIIVDETEHQRELSDSEVAECNRLALLRLNAG